MLSRTHLTILGLTLLAQAFCPSAEPAPAASPASPGWQQVGWGGGSFYWAAAWHPTADGVMYLGADCGGAYRTEDQGLQWRFANQGICDYGVFSLAVSPGAPDLVYALTDGGLCKSVDRAKTWTSIPASAATALDIRSKQHNTSTRAVAIDPENPAVVYAGSYTGKLFKTLDGGTTWHELPYLDALPKPSTPPAFSGTGALHMVYDATAASDNPVGRMSRMFGPGDKAKNWSAYKKLSARVRLPAGAPAVRAQLVVQSGDKWQWQAGAWIDCPPDAWIEVPIDLTTLSGMDSVRMIHLALSTFQPGWKGEVLVGTVALYTEVAGTLTAGQVPDGKDVVLVADWEKSGDAEGWTANRQAKDSLAVTAVRQSQEKSAGGCVTAVAVAASQPATVYVTNKVNGIFRSDDAGATWAALAAPKQVSSIAVSELDPAVVWAACNTDGLYRSLDRGVTWTAVNGGLKKGTSVHDVALHPAKPDLVYAIGNIGWSGTLYRSDDAGKTWSGCDKVKVNMPGNPTVPQDARNGIADLSWIVNLVVNPQNPEQLFICGNWRNQFSNDGGRTLEERSTGADNTCSTDLQLFEGKTYATAMDEGLLVSDNDGGEWRQLLPLKYTDHLSGHMWQVRLTKKGDKTRIVVTASPWQGNGQPNNPIYANAVHVSEDGGKTFIASTGLPGYVPQVNCMWGRSYPRALAVDPKNSDNLYLAMDGDPESATRTGGGVFRSTDGAKSWTQCTGLPTGRRMFYGLVVDPTDSKRIFWGTGGSDGGIWRSEDAGSSWQQVKVGAWCWNLETTASGTVLAGLGNNLWRSVDHGGTWQQISAFAGADQAVVGIAVDPADEQRMWLSRVTWSTSPVGGVQRATDGGKTWQDITGDLPYRHPLVLRYNATTHDLWAAGVGFFKLRQ